MLSRCDIFELDASQEEVLALMRSIARGGYHSLSPDDCLEVVDYIQVNGDDRLISMRLLEPSFRKVQYARSEGLDWRPLVQSLLQTLGRKPDTSRRIDSRDKDLRCLQQALDRHPDSVGDQQNYWRRLTKKSRASFFRVLARYKSAE